MGLSGKIVSGAFDVEVDGRKLARKTDLTDHAAIVTSGEPTVVAGGTALHAARLGDKIACPDKGVSEGPHIGGTIVTGSGTVLIGGQLAARLDDTTLHRRSAIGVAKQESSIMESLGIILTVTGILVTFVIVGASMLGARKMISGMLSPLLAQQAETKRLLAMGIPCAARVLHNATAHRRRSPGPGHPRTPPHPRSSRSTGSPDRSRPTPTATRLCR